MHEQSCIIFLCMDNHDCLSLHPLAETLVLVILGLCLGEELLDPVSLSFTSNKDNMVFWLRDPERRHSGCKVKGEADLDGVVKAGWIPEAPSRLAGQQDGCGGPWMFFVVSAHTYPLIRLPTRSLL